MFTILGCISFHMFIYLFIYIFILDIYNASFILVDYQMLNKNK